MDTHCIDEAALAAKALEVKNKYECKVCIRLLSNWWKEEETCKV